MVLGSTNLRSLRLFPTEQIISLVVGGSLAVGGSSEVVFGRGPV